MRRNFVKSAEKEVLLLLVEHINPAAGSVNSLEITKYLRVKNLLCKRSINVVLKAVFYFDRRYICTVGQYLEFRPVSTLGKLMDPSVDQVTELCLKKFRALPKTGKPTSNEWTVLAGVVLHNSANNSSKVVALGAGTKCIGQSKLCANGLIINDSHAEILARRALLRYLYRQIHLANQGCPDILCWKPEQKVFALLNNISFHFFSTQTPCGDACIATPAENIKEEQEVDHELSRKRRKLEQQVNEDFGSRLLAGNETVFTGAKLIGTAHSDEMQQTIGAVRIKPGRGDRTLSMSCSDKLSKWHLLGVQGALLDALLEEPIYFKTLNFCCCSEGAAIERAIHKRWQDKAWSHDRFKAVIPSIRYCNAATFEFQQRTADQQPSPNGLTWCEIEEKLKPYEISVNGKRQGVTAKKLQTPQAALKISKYFLLQEFVSILKNQRALVDNFDLVNVELEQVSYATFKKLATSYQAAWSDAKQTYFEQWTQKSKHLLDFSIEKIKGGEKS